MSDNVSGPPAGESWSYRGEWNGLDVYANDDGDVEVLGIVDAKALDDWGHAECMPLATIAREWRNEIQDAMRAALLKNRRAEHGLREPR